MQNLTHLPWTNGRHFADERGFQPPFAIYLLLVLSEMFKFSFYPVFLFLFLYTVYGHVKKEMADRDFELDDIFRCIFVTEKLFILIKISLKFFFPKGPIDNNPALV